MRVYVVTPKGEVVICSILHKKNRIRPLVKNGYKVLKKAYLEEKE